MADFHDDAELETPSDLLPFGYDGTVTDNADPDGMGRVRVLVPGVCEPDSEWALPIGTWRGGSASRGSVAPPEIGAQVFVLFAGGDIQRPRYLCGPMKRADMPPEYEASPNRAVYIDGAIRVEVEKGGENGGGYVRVASTRNGDMIQMNLADNTITVKATTALLLQATGMVKIEAAVVEINGRTVLPGGVPI